jgi:hypothetical protein
LEVQVTFFSRRGIPESLKFGAFAGEARLYTIARHQTSLKTGAPSGRWNLVIPQNSRGYCSWRTASSNSQGSYKPFRAAEEKIFSPARGNLPARGLYIHESLNEAIRCNAFGLIFIQSED